MAGEEVLTTRELVRQIALVLQRKPPGWHLPMWPFLAAAVVMESTLSPLGIQPPLHRRRLDFFRKSFLFSTLRARAQLGFVPRIPLSQGAVDTAEWYRTHGYLSTPK